LFHTPTREQYFPLVIDARDGTQSGELQ